MKKKDLIPIILIFALFLAYPTIDRKFIAKIFPPKAKPAPAAVEKAEAPSLPADVALAAPEAQAAPSEAVEDVPAPAEAPAVAEDAAPEVFTTLANERLQLTFSSRGAGIVRAVLPGYPSAKGSADPVAFDFSDRPAAAPIGYPGLGEKASFEVSGAGDDFISYRKTLADGLVLERKLTLGAGYQIQIDDTIANAGAAPIALRGYGIQAGFMENLPGEDQAQQVPLLGVDTLTGSANVEYWGG